MALTPAQEKARAHLAEQCEQNLSELRELRQRAVDLDEAYADARRRFKDVYARLAAASSNLPFGRYADYYTHDLSPAVVPFDVDSWNYSVEEYYGEMSDEALARLLEGIPSQEEIEAETNRLMEAARAAVEKLASALNPIRRFDGLAEPLADVKAIANGQWFVSGHHWLSRGTQLVSYRVVSLPQRSLLHQRLASSYESCFATINMVRRNLEKTVALVEGVVAELPFAEPLPNDKVPSLTFIDNLMYDRSKSIQIGNENKFEGSAAIGDSARANADDDDE